MIDASGQCVIPGLVDAHTHPVWEGDRVHEFAMKVITIAALFSSEKKISAKFNLLLQNLVLEQKRLMLNFIYKNEQFAVALSMLNVLIL